VTRFGAALALVLALVSGLGAVPAHAEPTPSRGPSSIDRTVVRFASRETGGAAAPRFVYERELAFEARLEALTEGDVREGAPPFRERHIRAALERHVTETVLESLGITPPPTPTDISRRMEDARLALIERVGGLIPLGEAARGEGIGESELQRLLRREALASLYLDRMVAPMLSPSDAELRVLLRTERTPFAGRPFDEVSGAFRRWYVSVRLGTALSAYYDGLRGRMTVVVIHGGP